VLVGAVKLIRADVHALYRQAELTVGFGRLLIVGKEKPFLDESSL
jgi:hypothetical protein